MAKNAGKTHYVGFYRPHDPVPSPVGDRVFTEQSHKASCDIHNIIRQFQMSGVITHIQKQQPMYIDLPSSTDYQQSLHTLMQAQDAFASLPSVVRDHFANDPKRFLAAFNDPKQADKLREFGLLQPEPPKPSPLARQEPASASPAPEPSK